MGAGRAWESMQSSRGSKWWVEGIQQASSHPWKGFLSDPSGQGVSSSFLSACGQWHLRC